ncbi:response regulator [Enterobacter hormaechei]
MGYTVDEAENGVAALEILENQPVSLVISDWDMPEMDGLTLCRRFAAVSSDITFI